MEGLQQEVATDAMGLDFSSCHAVSKGFEEDDRGPQLDDWMCLARLQRFHSKPVGRHHA